MFLCILFLYLAMPVIGNYNYLSQSGCDKSWEIGAPKLMSAGSGTFLEATSNKIDVRGFPAYFSPDTDYAIQVYSYSTLNLP